MRRYVGQGAEERVNDLVARTALRIPGAQAAAAATVPGRESPTAQHGIGALREYLARVLGVSRQSLWRYAAQGAPQWLLFALLGVAVSRGNREVAGKLLERELQKQ